MAQIKIKQVDGLQSILDALTIAVTSGSLKSSYTQNSHGFTAGMILSYVNGSWVPADATTEETLGRIVVESVVTANTFVGVQVGTITVPSWDLTPGSYYVVDESGTGIPAEFTSNDAYSISNPVLQALTSTIAHVLPWRPSIGKQIIEVPVSITQSALALPTEGDYQPTGLSMQYTPYKDGSVNVLINGISVLEGDGVKTAEVYFSNDGGVTAKSIANIEAGDEIYWNGSIAGFDLTGTDQIDVEYQRTINA